MSGDPVRQFSDLTGADEDTAKQMLAASGGDLDAAIALHFDAAGGGAAAEPMDTEPAAPNPPPALPAESDDELVGSILSNARQEADGDEKATGNANAWSGKGQALGSSSAAEATDGGASSSSDGPAEPAAPAEPAVPQYGERRNAKKIRVIFWSDGFTVEDVTAEEAAAEAAAKAPVAPRRTGLATLSTEKERSPDKPMPKLPELRSYEENKEFMKDLKNSVPPIEFREFDLSTGVPQPRPVDIMLGDMRPQAYPKELVQRANAAAAKAAKDGGGSAKAAPKMSAFAGEGRTLGGSSDPPAESGASGGEGQGGSGAWPTAERPPVVVDESAAVTEVQVRLPGSPQRFRLNKTHTVADLKQLIEAALDKLGEAPRAYTLMCGFPPKPLTDNAASVEAAGLVGAAVTHRWG